MATATPRKLVARGNYIQGQFTKVTEANGEVISRDPGDLDLAPVAFPFCYEHIQEAVTAAKQGFRAWKRLPISERLASVDKYRKLLSEKKEELARHLCYEVGKPLWEARTEVTESLNVIDFYLQQGKTFAVEKSQDFLTASVRHLPKGVIAVLPPANLPAYATHCHMIPALIFGNSIILKSSKLAPGTAQFIFELLHDSGMPAGTVNLLHGDSEVARRLSTHAEIDGIFFTGSYETGMKLKKLVAADFGKTLVLSMSGKNGQVIWNDADYQRALAESMYSAFVTAGQRYSTASRLLIHDRIFDKFVEDLHKLSKKIRIGHGAQEGEDAPFMGPLVSEHAMENYVRYQGMAVREGCEEIMRGKPLERSQRGYYVSPSLHHVKKPDPKSVYQKSEIFGPNIALYRIKELEEAAEILNQPQYGLVASVYTAQKENFLQLANEIKAGAVHWNQPTVSPAFQLPEGGIKKSGNYRPMGSLAYQQCTYPVSSIEGADSAWELPTTLPRL